MKQAAAFLTLLFFLNVNTCAVNTVKKKDQRLVSIAPTVTEILFALGLDEKIVGVTSLCDYPKEVLNKDIVGTFSHPDTEKIISLKPDIIFATDLEQDVIVERLRKLNLNVFVSSPENIAELFDSIKEIGDLTGRKENASRLIKRLESIVNTVQDRVKRLSTDIRPRVFIEIWNDPLMTAGKGSFIDELIYLAGGINIAHDVTRPYSYFSAEQVIKRNPDCIFIGHTDSDFVADRIGWRNISAVKYNRVYSDIDPDLLLRSGPRLFDGLLEIHKRLYPE
ncbi:MAG: cobalamin-binding protein [bacterium]|nr:cobalamin-binding protein [bacterium]